MFAGCLKPAWLQMFDQVFNRFPTEIEPTTVWTGSVATEQKKNLSSASPASDTSSLATAPVTWGTTVMCVDGPCHRRRSGTLVSRLAVQGPYNCSTAFGVACRWTLPPPPPWHPRKQTRCARPLRPDSLWSWVNQGSTAFGVAH